MRERFKMFTILMSKVSRCVHKIKSEEMAEFDLKSTHVSCLFYLYERDGMTAKELCDVCGEDKAAISRSLDYLESNGYLISNSKTLKKYKSPIELTEKGKNVAKIIDDKVNKILNEASAGLSEENRTIFYDSLLLISNNLEKICGKEGE